MTDRSPTPRVQRKRARNRQEIIAAARALLRQGGVDNVTLAAVAGALSLTKPALYHYFPSKEALLRNLTIRILEDELDMVIAAVDQEPRDDRVLGVMIRAFYAHHIDRLDEFRAIYCQTQLYQNPVELIDQGLLKQEINPRTRHLFDILESRLAGKSRGRVRRDKCRRLAYSAWLAALGLVTMLGVADAVQDALTHSDQDLLDTLVDTFDSAATRLLGN